MHARDTAPEREGNLLKGRASRTQLITAQYRICASSGMLQNVQVSVRFETKRASVRFEAPDTQALYETPACERGTLETKERGYFYPTLGVPDYTPEKAAGLAIKALEDHQGVISVENLAREDRFRFNPSDSTLYEYLGDGSYRGCCAGARINPMDDTVLEVYRA
jgi:hypothetical protein